MFRRIQNESLKKDRIWVRIRGAFLAKKGAPKLNFHREGGQLPPSAPPKSATVLRMVQAGYICTRIDLNPGPPTPPQFSITSNMFFISCLSLC